MLPSVVKDLALLPYFGDTLAGPVPTDATARLVQARVLALAIKLLEPAFLRAAGLDLPADVRAAADRLAQAGASADLPPVLAWAYRCGLEDGLCFARIGAK